MRDHDVYHFEQVFNADLSSHALNPLWPPSS
jgi:hypothetical protein